jgi:pimeloyl-ACP methyl ester carboxylesterase
MLGGSGGGKKRQLDGVIPRIADELFLRISRAQADSGGSVQFQVRATYLEVYEDNVFDLLSQPSRDEKRRTLEIRDASVPAAQVEIVTSTGVLMDLIARGSSQRATQATGIHDNSSRSHAIVTLTLERRWTKGKGQVRSSSCSLQLVDLAGSESTDRAHNGTADRAGCSINMGLLVLRRTIQALAAGAHVPYRSASLTKLLYPSLSGGSVTWMLATVSPEPIDAYESQQTMLWAQEARRLMMRPVAAPQVIEDASLNDPLYGDMEDSDEEMQRRCEWIQTATYGDVWARVAGDKSHSLLLMIHGSGPRNSSLQSNWLVEQVMSSDNSLKFFCVAVDCPGYGRTRGDRQIIRSYPGKFIAQVLTALGRSTAYAIIGSSQGACAVLNAALELPDIAHFVAVCHPVGHAPERYTAIQQPVLLAFDTEDAGHPVSVGRIMQRRLPRAHYFEFTTSKDGNWLEKEFGRELLNMFQAYPAARAKAGALTSRLPYLTRLSGAHHTKHLISHIYHLNCRTKHLSELW